MYKAMQWFKTRLVSDLSPASAFLPVSDEDYAELLWHLSEEGDQTELLLVDGKVSEFVVITNTCGVLVMERATPMFFPCGAGVFYQLTPFGIARLTCQIKDCENTDMKYKALVGFVSDITEAFSSDDTDLPIHSQHLAKLNSTLEDNTYTSLQVTDGVHYEAIKVIKSGTNLQVVRGLDGTTPMSFPEGSCVSWFLSPSAIRDIVCNMECC